jgi:hypothetical protein
VGYFARKKQEGKKELASLSACPTISQDLPKPEGTTAAIHADATPSFGNLAPILGPGRRLLAFPSLFPLQTPGPANPANANANANANADALQNVEDSEDHTWETAPTQFLGKIPKSPNPQIFKKIDSSIASHCGVC